MDRCIFNWCKQKDIPTQTLPVSLSASLTLKLLSAVVLVIAGWCGGIKLGASWDYQSEAYLLALEISERKV